MAADRYSLCYRGEEIAHAESLGGALIAIVTLSTELPNPERQLVAHGPSGLPICWSGIAPWGSRIL